MFGYLRDEVTAPVAAVVFSNTEERETDGLGGSAREGHLGRMGTHEVGDVSTGKVDGFFSLPAVSVRTTGRITVSFGKVRQHYVEHPLVDGCCRVMVEIDDVHVISVGIFCGSA